MLLSRKLIALIETNAEELTTKWMEIVRTHPDTPTYHTHDPEQLHERAYSVYSQLGKWLSDATTKDEIQEIYSTLGRHRREEGFTLSEVLQALTITRRVLWLKIESDGLLDSALDMSLAMHLSNRTVLFFDRAMFYTARGYES
jgi:hypothetical protein